MCDFSLRVPRIFVQDCSIVASIAICRRICHDAILNDRNPKMVPYWCLHYKEADANTDPIHHVPLRTAARRTAASISKLMRFHRFRYKQKPYLAWFLRRYASDPIQCKHSLNVQRSNKRVTLKTACI